MKSKLITGLMGISILVSPSTFSHAGIPVWTFKPLRATSRVLPANGTALIQYQVRNQSPRKTHRLIMAPIPGISQDSPCTLRPRGQAGDSCTLTLRITANKLPKGGVSGGPRLCQATKEGTPNFNQCYQPYPRDSLNIRVGRSQLIVTPKGDGNESIDPNTPQKVDYGTTRAFTVTANGGYTLSHEVGGTCPTGSWSENTYITGRITANCSVHFSSTKSTSFFPGVATTNGGQSWNLSNTTTGVVDRYRFNSVSCNGTGSTARCTAAGQDYTTTLALLYQSTNGGSTWSPANTGIMNQGTFYATSCSGPGSSARCTAAGIDYSTGLPLLYQSTNGGSTWSVVNTGITNQGAFYATSCSGTGSTARCTAAGTDSTTNSPLLYQSTDGGSSWSAANTGITNQGSFNATSCSGTDSTGRCTAAGQDYTTGLPLLYQSTDGGSSWSAVNTGITNQGSFNATSCSGTGNSTRCTAAGRDSTTSLPLLYQSTDGGSIWSAANTGITNQGVFYATSCSGMGGTAKCTAAGEDFTTNLPLLYQSTNGGTTWSAANTGITNQGVFYATSCSSLGGISRCTAAGRDYTTGLPLLYQSINGGNSWSAPNTGITNQGDFYATSCSDKACTALGQFN
ncbi:hypothetical protein [Legionella sp. km772]|uniref:WD40/YVTN/BNR-like repeat-containing protein n=1 Tax=Legionella sp. km772 TaxID=2498111 RepID=UPI000F8E0C6E|nr:hypothetical protein [Legionella sp. km772]RUR06259.1 hypothetical protein ELY15_13365 [Legionella sp. km772]